MAVFRNSSRAKKANMDPTQAPQPQIDDQNGHYTNAEIHDPILKAVNEAQPFEEATAGHFGRRPSYLSQASGELKDPFGQKIRQADMLNPARSRNERPLDTIRGFEYQITGDMSYRDQLELDRLGWGFHEDFPHYSLLGQGDDPDQLRPVASFSGGEQAMYQANNYSASSLKPEGKKKKKGLFGRKKK